MFLVVSKPSQISNPQMGRYVRRYGRTWIIQWAGESICSQRGTTTKLVGAGGAARPIRVLSVSKPSSSSIKMGAPDQSSVGRNWLLFYFLGQNRIENILKSTRIVYTYSYIVLRIYFYT